ncbi:MAG: (2Fe-2S)-binding protein [Betaproteobacteria bacterium HGW-Betaproteobacteria-9]|nr:MAG: (2Fe-2S)-binding protein [Betaproteobacteria bacterium HGW-Betaproteobacteria-9]
MGRMLKQHWWIPAAVSEKLVADGAPQRIRLFGENYVAFRATDGKVGFFDEACPHRGASMALARNEDNALRCIYHGWKFTVEGVTVEVPTQPQNEAEYCKHVPLKHFPVREEAGVVWVWLGEGGTPPKFQDFAFVGLPMGHTIAFRQKVNCNWLQGVETTMDSAHLGVLHQSFVQGQGAIQFASANKAPVYQVEQKPYGFRYAAIRSLPEDKSYVRTNSFVLPWYGVISPSSTEIQGGNFFFSVPIDDENIWYWHITYQLDTPLAPVASRMYTDPDNWPPLPPGGEDTNWGQNRQIMQQGHFTGYPQSLGTEDFAVITSQTPIVDRTNEYLGAGDGAVVHVRRCLLSALHEFMDNKTPALADHAAISYPTIRPISALFTGETRWQDML